MIQLTKKAILATLILISIIGIGCGVIGGSIALGVVVTTGITIGVTIGLTIGSTITFEITIGCEFDPNTMTGRITAEDVEQVIKCEAPYMRFGTGCCLDNNKDNICDEDEKHCKNVKVPYQTTEKYTETETYTVQEPYQKEICNDLEIPYTVTEQKTQTLFNNQDVSLASSSRLINTVHLKEDILVDISMRTDDDVYLWAMDVDEYENRVLKSLPAQDYLVKKNGESIDTSFRTVGEDDYVIYIKNHHLFTDVAVFEFTAVAKWSEQVEKTKTETQCHTETRYKDVEKTREVPKERIVTKFKTEEVCA